MLLTPVDNINTGKSTYLFGYIKKSAKLDLVCKIFPIVQPNSVTRSAVPFNV